LGWNVPVGAGGLAEALELLLEAAGAVVDGVVAALAELPANRAAPMAPPVRVDAANATPTTALRRGFMSISLCFCWVGLEPFESDAAWGVDISTALAVSGNVL
jgi:hypothetical protein